MPLEHIDLTLHVGEDNVLRWVDMVDDDGGSVADATVTFTLYGYDKTVADQLGAAIVGATAIAMPHVSGGTYEGVLDSSVALSANTKYWLEMVANSGEGRRRMLCLARYHGKDS